MMPLFKNNEEKVQVVLRLQWQRGRDFVAKRFSCKSEMLHDCII